MQSKLRHVGQRDVLVAVEDLECLTDKGTVEDACRVEDIGRGCRRRSRLMLATAWSAMAVVVPARSMVERSFQFNGDLRRRPQVPSHLVYSA